ncbi:integrase [Mycolicibacterium canariasense]|uniref:Integrase n=1 Tax=Mycolicibacterium canariasense TaxID=228230 RepID=A0A100WIM9_MYCCR|nr:tyrosine-type recombinase/integrase [Mycolicibacterium canariasense]MCV7210215.1 tyrosine-type recombinase/integrase [Mycolicibacterium canariasense]ORU98483.1 integrase [Mycolicibacterium canariasense]GAS98875.1 integrase [Mycolicibacterium canariasense]
MPRQRLAPGEHGKVTTTRTGNAWVASTYVRLHTGQLREREASSAKSAEDARRTLLRRIKAELERSVPTGEITMRTTLSQLFEAWIAAKTADGLKKQSEDLYRQAWRLHGHRQLGALRIAELSTSRADAHFRDMPPSQAQTLRVVLTGMYAMAARHDVVRTNPIRETQPAATQRKAARALTAAELEEVRAAVRAYAAPSGRPGPPRGVMLPAYVELLAATGDRPGEVLAIRWPEVDLLGDPPTVTVSGTLIDHGRIRGKALHRQDVRKGDAPPHTVLLPQFGVDVLTELFGLTGAADGPVLTNRNGDWISPSNIASALREALSPYEHLRWVTPHSFRRTVATVVRDGMGIEAAQAQLSHAQLSTTESHYAQRRTVGPDARAVLQKFAGDQDGT